MSDYNGSVERRLHLPSVRVTNEKKDDFTLYGKGNDVGPVLCPSTECYLKVWRLRGTEIVTIIFVTLEDEVVGVPTPQQNDTVM